MGRKFTVYGLRFSKTSFWNRMNTGFLDPAVATVPTACGIETCFKAMLLVIRNSVATVPTACGIETPISVRLINSAPGKLQQYLPLAVLKQCRNVGGESSYFFHVATVPTACGIETFFFFVWATVFDHVATVPTACGIETKLQLSSAVISSVRRCNSTYRLRY